VWLFIVCPHRSYGYHGDEGKKYSGTTGGIGEAYGPPYSTGDVIGVGIDNTHHTIFFTKNGKHLGSAFTRAGVLELYPCVGLHSPGQVAIVNFAPPFIYNISNNNNSVEDGKLEDNEVCHLLRQLYQNTNSLNRFRLDWILFVVEGPWRYFRMDGEQVSHRILLVLYNPQGHSHSIPQSLSAILK
jgi:hypothetical protein